MLTLYLLRVRKTGENVNFTRGVLKFELGEVRMSGAKFRPPPYNKPEKTLCNLCLDSRRALFCTNLSVSQTK